MRNKIISIMLIMVLSIVLIAQVVNAASLTVTMKPSSSSVKEATEFTVKVSVSNLDVGDNGINSLTGYLKYDNDIFEKIDESSIEGLNKWKATYDDSTGKVELTKSTFVKTSQEVFQIVFKTKSGVADKSGAISFSDIKASNSEDNIDASDISVSISVTAGDGSSNTENSTNSSNTSNSISITASSNSNSTNNTSNRVSNNTINNTTNNTSNNTSNSSSNYTNTTSDENMPKTGVSDTVVSMILILIVVALVFYIKYEKINRDFK